MADLRTVATALEAYATDHNRYPEATDVSSLNSALVPTYVRVVPGNDGWAHAMRYSAWSSDGARVNSYAVASGGKDGSFSHESLRDYLSSPGSDDELQRRHRLQQRFVRPVPGRDPESIAMYCTNCGQPRPDDAPTCPNCSVPIRRPNALPGAPVQIPNYLVQSGSGHAVLLSAARRRRDRELGAGRLTSRCR